MTKLYSTIVFVVAALIAILLGFSPKFGALIRTIPPAVLGGMSIVVFGLIAVAGAKIWVDNRVDFSRNRNLILAAVTLVLGAGDFALSIGGFVLGGIGTATFGAILPHLVFEQSCDDLRQAILPCVWIECAELRSNLARPTGSAPDLRTDTCRLDPDSALDPQPAQRFAFWSDRPVANRGSQCPDASGVIRRSGPHVVLFSFL